VFSPDEKGGRKGKTRAGRGRRLSFLPKKGRKGPFFPREKAIKGRALPTRKKERGIFLNKKIMGGCEGRRGRGPSLTSEKEKEEKPPYLKRGKRKMLKRKGEGRALFFGRKREGGPFPRWGDIRHMGKKKGGGGTL